MTWKPAGARAHPSVSTELRPGPKALRLCKTAPVVWKRRAIRAASEGPHSLRGRRRCFQPGGEPRVCLWAPVQDEPRSHGFQAKTAAGLQQRALPKRTNDADVSCVLDQVLNPVRKGAAKNNRSARRHRCQKAANNDDDGRGEDLKIRAFRQPSRNAHYGSKTRDANAGPGRRGEIATQRPSPCEGVPRTLRFAPLGLCDDIPWSQGRGARSRRRCSPSSTVGRGLAQSKIKRVHSNESTHTPLAGRADCQTASGFLSCAAFATAGGRQRSAPPRRRQAVVHTAPTVSQGRYLCAALTTPRRCLAHWRAA